MSYMIKENFIKNVDYIEWFCKFANLNKIRLIIK